jgi:hypothetical protein
MNKYVQVAKHFELDVNEMESELMAHHEDAPQLVTLDAYNTCLDRERERTHANQRETEFAGTQFTCFAGTKGQILTQERMPALGEATLSSAAGNASVFVLMYQ